MRKTTVWIALLVCPWLTAVAQAQVNPNCTAVYQVLHSFTEQPDGMRPYTGLIADGTGNLYGVTERGGLHGNGTVFMVDSTGTQTTLHSFAGVDGAWPSGKLRKDKVGNLFGVTYSGGKYNNGTVFRLSQSGQLTVLHSFGGTSADGTNPVGGLIRDATGNFYGTTRNGGTNGKGTIFKLNPKTREEIVLYSFTGGIDGALPHAGVIMDAAGNLYGTTATGGIEACSSGAGPGCGAVFKLDPSLHLTVLHTFSGQTDGGYPVYGPLLRDSTGNLYGTTVLGGSGHGVIFKLDAEGNETVLYTFSGGADGSQPYGGVIRNAAGVLFGSTSSGGSDYGDSGNGVVFRLGQTGNLTVLHSFTGPDGSHPVDALVGSKGFIYGTTPAGGELDHGVVFKLIR